MARSAAVTAQLAALRTQIENNQVEHASTFDQNSPERNQQLRDQIATDRAELLHVGRRRKI